MFLEPKCEPQRLNPIMLAFVGDAVLEILVRELLAADGDRPAATLHSDAVKMVRASAQSEAAKIILPLLTEEETAIFKRGRNAHTSHTPRGASVAEYHTATALEALFGWLYLENENERLTELFKAAFRVK